MRVAVLAAALCLSVGLAVAGDAEASMKKHTDIPAQALGTALKALAKDRGIQLVFRSEVVGSIRTQGATGELTTKEALTKLLEGTDLVYSFLDENTVTIMPKAEVAPGSAAGPEDPGRGGSSNQPTTQEQPNSDGFRMAQVDQGAPSSNSSAKKEGEEESKRKPEQLQEVVVTGTHIRGATNPSAPMIVLDRADIERSGYTTVQELAASIPQNFGGGSTNATEDGLLGSGALHGINDSFATGINLRGLGTSSTLVLVNGQRVASSAQGLFVDVSIIPLAVIERVEIMTDGASAVYGADAVAGVVNFILRKEYRGQETWASYGSGTDGTRHQETIGQSIGRDWSGGNAFAALQYQDIGDLSAADRPYTASNLLPFTLLPESRQYSVVLNLRQDLSSGFDLSSNVLYARKDQLGATSEPGPPNLTIFYSPHSDAGVATVSLGYQPTEQWRIQTTGSISLTDTTATTSYIPQLLPACASCPHHDNFKEESVDLVADGTIFRTPSGDAKAAFGLSYRNEYASETFPPDPQFNVGFDRHVTAEFAEVEIPVIGAPNAQPLMKAIDLSLAVRRDDYSDFGSTTNPRYGFSWKPVEGMRVRAAYSTSFRAPNAFEAESAAAGPPSVFEFTFPSSPSTMVPIFYQTARPETLEPEKSRNWTAGIEFTPSAVPTFKASIDFFDIRYRDRIITPGFPANALSQLNVYGSLITQFPNDAAAQSYISQIQSEGGVFANFGGPLPAGSGVRYLLNAYEQNASLQTVSGLDITAGDRFSIGGNELSVNLNAAYIAHLDTSYTATSTPADLVNTYANPLHWRARGQFGWSRGPWAISTAVNFSGSYVDNTTLPFASIASWTTIDAQVAYEPPLLKNLKLSLSGANLLNRDPPYVAGNNQFLPTIHYDVGNGNPLGRVVILSARLAW